MVICYFHHSSYKNVKQSKKVKSANLQPDEAQSEAYRENRIQAASLEDSQVKSQPQQPNQQQHNTNDGSVDISLVDESAEVDSLYFEETTEEAEMLSVENLYEAQNGYVNGEYGALVRRFVSNRQREDSITDLTSF